MNKAGSFNLTRRNALLAGVALLATPAILRADAPRLSRLVLQTPGSGPAILMAHARALGLFDAIADEVHLSIWTTGDEMRAGLVSGSVPVSVVPTQAAASLYNRGFGIRLVATLTDGHCGLVARGMEGCTIPDLRGKSVVVPAFNDFTGHMMRLALAHHGVGLDTLTLIPALLPEDLDKLPAQLSGGMRARVAIARALVVDPEFLIFDEPFAALDPALRRRMQDLVLSLAEARGFGGLFITHDLTEAARLSHRIAVMDRQGKGILGSLIPPGTPGARSEAQIFDFTQDARNHPLLHDLVNVDERAIALDCACDTLGFQRCC